MSIDIRHVKLLGDLMTCMVKFNKICELYSFKKIMFKIIIKRVRS